MRTLLIITGLAVLAGCSSPRGVGFDDYSTYTQSNPRPADPEAIHEEILIERGIRKPSDATD
ncbi:hypothetical protein [Jhaorihella thermophila]|uniref:Lipoprotein n=1 Tax=Jhaorihella thermophila TaxID=488547 RepID=A0A1H5Y4D4_9RHOB|nr:hypothetical protein [Jhaorihella thermophila]SEG18386.1 hypothetical protein SAMN05421751_11440 [Jhaorihella thermophila]